MPISYKLAFDIGHSSIGWAVLTSDGKLGTNPEILGCGSVIFPKDDCLASQRRDHRRTRRNIRSTRQRISRMRKLLLHLEVLSEVELDAVGHSAPHYLAAQALFSESPTLDWTKLWHVLRWYAHNRGYDGNSRWSRQDDDSDDTVKEKAALDLMSKHGIDTKTGSMAETICAELGINPLDKKISSAKPYKTLNAAFPRAIVRSEVLRILMKHLGHLPKLDQNFIDTLIAPNSGNDKQAWATIPVPSIKLPRRYFGGLLFGQLIPRFDNRIIASCPISGQKVPNKASRDYLEFRWAMLLANIRVNGTSLSAEQRRAIDAIMRKSGRLTPTELRKAVEDISGSKDNNIAASFEIHPDSKDALELDPALAYADSAATNKRNSLYPFWQHLSETIRARAIGRWKKGRRVDLMWMLAQFESEHLNPSKFTAVINSAFAVDQKKTKPNYPTRDHFLRRLFAPKSLSGRAPYSRSVMKQVSEFVLSTDRHPTEAGKSDLPAGPIYRSKEVLAAQRDKPINELTNNHLIRQRLDILLRLTSDIISNYCEGDPRQISDIVVEVASDLREFSGLTAKEMAASLSKRLAHFKSAVKYLEDNAPELEINGSLIRKTRIAMDLDWHCPFTGKPFDPYQLKSMEREHIIPYSDRPTNSLDSLVLTFDWVNKLKGKRTAMQFINDMAEDDRFLTPKNYKSFVDKLKVANKYTYPDDYRRQTSRKRLLLVETFEQKDHGFTQGALTKTSHLNRLSARQLEKKFVDPETNEPTVQIVSIPGQVTAETRKSWNLLHTLDNACPECIDKTKTEIRDITHLHHALDAATLALTHHYLPGTLHGQAENEKGAIWRAMLKRNKTLSEIQLLTRTGQFIRCTKKSSNGEPTNQPDARLVDISNKIKNSLATRLAEIRVVQHIPADQSGAHLELNPWRVDAIDGDPEDPTTLVSIRQTVSTVEKGKRIKKQKEHQ